MASLLSFGEAIALVRQRLNASSGRAAAVVREALKSGVRIIRDDHTDPISGSLFAIVEEDFLAWLNRQVSTTATAPLAAREQPDRERVRQAAIELWGTAGPPDHLSNSSICREVAQWLKKNGQGTLATLRSFAPSAENNSKNNRPEECARINHEMNDLFGGQSFDSVSQ